MATKSPKEKNLFEFQQDLLIKEIEYIHSEIARYDALSFQVKGWALTIWSALIAFGVKENIYLIIAASFPAIIAFWVIDANFKQYQRRSTSRKAVIELFLDSKGIYEKSGLRESFSKGDFGQFPIHDPTSNRTKKLNKEFEDRFRKKTRFWKAFTVSNVFFFYLPLVLGTVIAIVLLNK
ncbi:MAG: hypothetical protein J0L96_08185 [Anaerolineae bacterium]|nr:hypothetical protein [Anaerolineae bacterium]